MTLDRSLWSTLLLGALALTFLIVLFSYRPQPVASQGAGTPITGYAWSETIGWISFSCLNNGSCGTNNFGVSIDGSGNITGYAWSENIGWIKFGGLSSFPTQTGTLPVNAYMASTTVRGWARACAGTAAGDCSSMTSRTDGWDGWISLSSTSSPTYAPAVSNNSFSGYAWGDTNVGWISFSYASTTWTPCTARYYCSGYDQYYEDAYCANTFQQTCSYQCSSGACVAPPAPSGTITAHPSFVHSTATSSIAWSTTNTPSCKVTGSNGDSWQGTSGTRTSSAIVQSTTFTLECWNYSASATTTVGTATITQVPAWQEI